MQPRRPLLRHSALRALATTFGLWVAALPTRAAEPAPAAADDERIERLEQRVEHIDHSLAQILQLLQAQQKQPADPVATADQPPVPPAPPPPGATAATPAVATASTPSADTAAVLRPTPNAPSGPLQPGALHDVWLRPTGYKGGVPATPSLVTIRDTRGPFFNLGRHIGEAEMAGNIGKPLVQVWRCHLHIKNAGTHVLIAEFQRKKDRMVAKDRKWDDYLFSWTARLDLGEKTLLDETNRFESTGKGTLSRTFSLDLEPGYYAVQLVTWMPKQDDDEAYDLKPLTFALRLREPGQLKPRDLGPADLFSAE